MNKTDLVNFLRNPNKLSIDDLVDLEHLIESNPYFLSARLLLAKGSKELKHPDTKKRIASAAVYSTDRALLKKYLSGNLLFLSEPPAVQEQASEPIAKMVVSKKAESSENGQASKKAAPRTDKRPSALRKESLKPTPQVPDLPHHSGLDDILDELKQDMENLKSSRTKFAEVQERIEEEDALMAALERATQIASEQMVAEVEAPASEEPGGAAAKADDEGEQETPKTAPETGSKEVEKNPAVNEAQKPNIIDEPAPQQKKKSSRSSERKATKVSAADVEKAFANKSTSKNEETPSATTESSKSSPVEEQSEADKKPTAEESDTNTIFTPDKPARKVRKVTRVKRVPRFGSEPKTSFVPGDTQEADSKDKDDTKKKALTTEHGATEESEAKKTDKSSIIDSFIEKSPSIKRKDDASQPVGDLAQQSGAWDPNVASEHLAEIYLKQGNKKRAREIYETLSLKYPEKKSYFADLISKIE